VSVYTEWPVRIVPPVQGNVRVIPVTNVSAAIELDNDVFQFPAGGGGGPRPASYGRARLCLQAEGADMYVVFGSTNGVVANSAVQSTITANVPSSNVQMAMIVPQITGGNPIGVIVEINPSTHKFFAVATKNGVAGSGSLRYWLVSYPLQMEGTNQGGA
jgi:hypothetical protein